MDVVEVDCETGEVEARPMTQDEQAQRDVDAEQLAALQEERVAAELALHEEIQGTEALPQAVRDSLCRSNGCTLHEET